MTQKQSIFLVASLILTFTGLTPKTEAQSNSKNPDSPVIVGTLTNVDSLGNELDVQQNGENLRKLSVERSQPLITRTA